MSLRISSYLDLPDLNNFLDLLPKGAKLKFHSTCNIAKHCTYSGNKAPLSSESTFHQSSKQLFIDHQNNVLKTFTLLEEMTFFNVAR